MAVCIHRLLWKALDPQKLLNGLAKLPSEEYMGNTQDTQSLRLLERMARVGFFIYLSSLSCNSSWRQAFT